MFVFEPRWQCWAEPTLLFFPYHDDLFGGGSRVPLSVGKSLTVRSYLFGALRRDFVLNGMCVIKSVGVGHFPGSCSTGGDNWSRYGERRAVQLSFRDGFGRRILDAPLK